MTSPLATVDEAWIHWMTRILPGLAMNQTMTEETRADDEKLAAFLAAHPGEFERKLLGGLDAMANTGRGRGTELSLLFPIGRPSPGRPLQRTLEAMDPALGLEIYATICSRYRATIPEGDKAGIENVIRYFTGTRDAPLDVLDKLALPPELNDSINRRRSKADILPADLEEMTVEELEAAFETYMAMPIAEIEARLRPGGHSDSGFLAADDRLAEVVWRDARRLRDLGVSRHALCDRAHDVLEDVARRAPPNHWHRDRIQARLTAIRGEVPSEAELDVALKLELHGYDKYPRVYYLAKDDMLEVSVTGYLGKQTDPFHTLPVIRSFCSIDFEIVRKQGAREARVEGAGLTIDLVRRACFFEGNVPYRLEPEQAARALGLLPLLDVE